MNDQTLKSDHIQIWNKGSLTSQLRSLSLMFLLSSIRMRNTAMSNHMFIIKLRKPLYPLLCLLVTYAYAQDITFSFSSFEASSNLTLHGDAMLSNGSIEITKDSAGVSTGRALYSQPIRLFYREANFTPSFSTSFSFSVINENSIHFGDGLAFIIVPNHHTIGGSGGWLGVLNGTEDLDDKMHSFAVEFDTFLNVEFMDPNDNHVGVDVNSMESLQYADAGSQGIELKSGLPITAWIDYDTSRQELEVSLSYSTQKPQKRLLSLSPINLGSLFNEYMYVGFSAATGGNVELHSVHSWSLSTSGSPKSNHFAPLSSTPSPSAPASSEAIVGKSHCRGITCLDPGPFFGISISSAFVVAILLVMLLWWSWKKWKCLRRTNSFRSDMVQGPHKFTYKDLCLATKGFSPSRILGHGAFGSVYKGIMPDSGLIVAVKRGEGSKQGKSEFVSELSIIGRLRHRNLVQLQGWCQERGELLLVYDFMPNGSLDRHLFCKNSNILTWPIRFKIVSGVAAALAYLHSEWDQLVVHRDVKTSNIMLDASFNARLGDFGLARLVEHNSSPETTITAGTLGYLAPEYLHTGKATDKTDVFSFGAVVLEVATGRRAIERDLPTKNEAVILVDWVWKLHKTGSLLEAADPKLGGAFDPQEMSTMLQVGLLCSHPDPLGRPSMKQALQILAGVLPLPQLPRFKPMPSFASHPPLSIQDIIADNSRISP